MRFFLLSRVPLAAASRYPYVLFQTPQLFFIGLLRSSHCTLSLAGWWLWQNISREKSSVFRISSPNTATGFPIYPIMCWCKVWNWKVKNQHAETAGAGGTYIIIQFNLYSNASHASAAPHCTVVVGRYMHASLLNEKCNLSSLRMHPESRLHPKRATVRFDGSDPESFTISLHRHQSRQFYFSVGRYVFLAGSRH